MKHMYFLIIFLTLCAILKLNLHLIFLILQSSMAKPQRGEGLDKEYGTDTAVHDIDLRIKELQRSLRMKKARIETMAKTES